MENLKWRKDRWDRICIYESYFNEVKGELKKLSFVPLKDGDKVFFHSSCVFPRRKFTTYYPNNKIAKSPKTADVIIMDKKSLDVSAYFSTSEYVNGSYRAVPEEERIGRINDREVKFIQVFMDECLGKPVVDIGTLAVKSDVIMDEETTVMIEKLFASGTSDNMNLAVSMLSSMDYGKYKFEIMKIFRNNSHNWMRNNSKVNSVEVKTLLTNLHKDFPGYDIIDMWTKVRFILMIEEKYPTKDLEESVVDTLSYWVPDLKKYKLVKKEEV